MPPLSQICYIKIAVILVIFLSYFKVCLGMSAYGANGGGGGANYYMTAVAAFPNLNACLFEYALGFNVL